MKLTEAYKKRIQFLAGIRESNEIKRMVREMLKDKITYPFSKIEKFVDWFKTEYEDYMNKQGWDIFLSYPPVDKYNAEDGALWQVQVIDEPEEFYDKGGNALIGISTDQEAWDRAAKLGIMLDDDGVIIGYKGQTFFTQE